MVGIELIIDWFLPAAYSRTTMGERVGATDNSPLNDDVTSVQTAAIPSEMPTGAKKIAVAVVCRSIGAYAASSLVAAFPEPGSLLVSEEL